MNVQERFVNLIQTNYMIPENTLVSQKTDLIKDLHMDSVALMQLIVDVEEYFQISFEDVDLLAENFCFVGDFCHLIEKMLVAKGKENVILEKTEG